MQPFIQITEKIALPLSDTYAFDSVSMDEVKLVAFAQKHGLDVRVTTRGTKEYPFRYVCKLDGCNLTAISELEYLAD